MIDFEIMERALKVAWIKKHIVEGGDASWKTILNYAVGQFGGVKTLNLELLPEFYRTVYVIGKNSSVRLIAKKYPCSL